MRKLLALAVLVLSAACASGRVQPLPDPFAKFHDQTGLVNGQKLTRPYVERVYRAGHIQGLQAFLSCHVAQEEKVIRDTERNLSDYRAMRARQAYWRYNSGDDYYISNTSRRISTASEKLATMKWNAQALRLRTNLPCTDENAYLANLFLENHLAKIYEATTRGDSEPRTHRSNEPPRDLFENSEPSTVSRPSAGAPPPWPPKN